MYAVFTELMKELTASLAPLLRARLGDGCHVIYVANTDTIDKAWQRMEEAGLHRSAYEGTGVLQIIPAQTGFLEGGPVYSELLLEYLQGVISAAKEVPDSRLCLFSEKAWMLSQGLETQELLNYESRSELHFFKKRCGVVVSVRPATVFGQNSAGSSRNPSVDFAQPYCLCQSFVFTSG